MPEMMFISSRDAIVRGLNWLEECNKGKFMRTLTDWENINLNELNLNKNEQRSLELLARDIQTGTYDFEGYASRLSLVSYLQLVQDNLLGNWIGDIWAQVVGDDKEEVKRRLQAGVSIFDECLHSKSKNRTIKVHPDDRETWWPFCTEECKSKYICLFSFLDLIEIFMIPERFPNTEVGNEIGKIYENGIKKTLTGIIEKSFIPAKSGWPSAIGSVELEPVVTTNILAYLGTKSKNNLLKMKIKGKKIFEESTLKSLPLLQNYQKHRSSDPLRDGYWKSSRTNISPKRRRLLADSSLSPTIAVANCLITIFSFDISESVKEELGKILFQLLKYFQKKMQQKKFETYCYSRDYYLQYCPISDVKGAIQLIDVVLNFKDSNLIQINEIRKGLASIDQLLHETVEWLRMQQRPSGCWPLLSQELHSNSSLWSSKPFIGQFNPILKEKPQITNISFNNTLKALSTLYKYMLSIAARTCPKCNKKYFGTDWICCTNCGTPLTYS